MMRPAEQYELFGTVCNGEAAEADRQMLECLLTDDAEARRRYLNYITLHTQLRDRIQGMAVTRKVVPQARFHMRRWAAVAALVLVAGMLWIIVPSKSTPKHAEPSEQTHSVALVTNLDRAVFDDGGAIELGGELAPGMLALRSGRVQVMFNSGAVVDLTGPCRFRMIDAGRAMLDGGSLLAYVPERGRGFTVEGPGGVRVVDLGTRFTMTVDELRQTRVLVLEGTVALSLSDGRVDQQVELLTAGYEMIADPMHRTLVRMDNSHGPITITGDAVLTSGPADGTIYRHTDTAKGGGAFEHQDLIVGSATGPADYNGIAMFRLPQRTPNGLSRAELRLTVATEGRLPNANVDVWALGYVSSPIKPSSKWMLTADADDRTGQTLGVEPTDAKPVKIADDMIPADSFHERDYTWQTDTTQSTALCDYINSLYEQGAEAGDWLVIRINPDAPVGNTYDGVAHPFAAIRFGGSHRVAPDRRACLLLSVSEKVNADVVPSQNHE
ncbi:FecR domain-containing protein [Planctomycetales bacterium ZRK34]|nr:FecR domain-containing protein [Planctomycetales bacterium ZRK34]